MNLLRINKEVDYNNLKFYEITKVIKDIPICEKIEKYHKRKIQNRVTINITQLDNQDLLINQFFLKNPIIYDVNKNWWKWDDKKMKYVLCSDDIEITMKFNYCFDLVDVKTLHSSSIRSTILNALKEASKVFYEKFVKNIKPHWVVFKDAIVDIETGETFKNSPEYFATNVIPYNYFNSKETETPNIDRLFSDWVINKDKPDGKNWVRTLKEIFAYSMIPSYPIEDIFVFYGEGRNGKSTCLNLLTEFIGFDNTTSVEFDMLINPNQKFVTSNLYKKLVCIMGEIDDLVVKNSKRLKSLVSGKDPTVAEFKNKTPFQFINYAKIIMATNYIPSTTDLSDAYARRFVILDFPNQFEQNGNIISKISEKEMSNFARQLIPILKKIYAENHLTNEGTVEEKKERYHKRSDPVQAFINDCCVLDMNSEIPVFEFFDYFEMWRNQRNYKPLSKKAVTQFIKSNIGLEVVLKRPKEHPDKSWRFYQGIKWNKNFVRVEVDVSEDGTFENHENLDVNKFEDKIYKKEEVYDLFASYSKQEVDEKIKLLKKQGNAIEVRSGEFRFSPGIMEE